MWIYIEYLALSLCIQAVAGAIAIFLQTEKFYDLTGSLTFISLSYLSLEWTGHPTQRQFVQTHMIMAWAVRLGLFLFVRVLKTGKDRRFDKIKLDGKRFTIAWALQGVWVFITLLPTLVLNNTERNPKIGTQDFIGWAMWLTGFLFEVIADSQKSLFKMNPQNKEKFIGSGLWSISRHPNYFGEILLWFGLYVSASSTFRGWQLLTVLSPVFVHLLITRVSGIPLLERAALKRWGHTKEYKEYLKNTPPLVPFVNW